MTFVNFVTIYRDFVTDTYWKLQINMLELNINLSNNIHPMKTLKLNIHVGVFVYSEICLQ